MRLSMSPALTRAVGDAVFLQEAVLTPVSDNLLGIRAANGTPDEACLRSTMAQVVIDLMEAFANRRHIGPRTETAFTQALSFLVNGPGSIPGFSPEHVATTRDLKAALATSAETGGFRPLKDTDGLFHVMAAAILVVARARAGDIPGQEEIFPEGSVLHEVQSALPFLLRLHARLQMREKLFSDKALPGLSDKDILKIRMILDIAEGTLPPLDHQRMQDERRARIEKILTDPGTQSETVTLTLAKDRAGA